LAAPVDKASLTYVEMKPFLQVGGRFIQTILQLKYCIFQAKFR